MKSCPRCLGQMLVDQGMDGSYWDCMACGHQIDIKTHASGIRLMSSLMNEADPILPDARPYLMAQWEAL